MFQVLRESNQRRTILLLSGAVAFVILLTAAAQVRLNSWQGAFYNAISRYDLPDFTRQLLVFGAIIAALVVLGVGQTWCQELLKIKLRDGLTRDLLDRWLQPQRAYRLSMVGEVGVNPDQRLQEDARHLTELTASLGVGLFQATILLVSFVGVLWGLSDLVSFPIGGKSVTIPGYMVWCAVLYASAGSALAWWVGRPLVKLNEEHYAREAALRYSLVRISEAAEGIALHGGEPAEREQLEGTLSRVLVVMRQLADRLAGLTWITSSYGYVALIVPIVVAAPGYFHGTLNFGQLMMVVGAFNQVQQALRWSVDNFPTIADWRATFMRVMTLYDALVLLGEIDTQTGQIARTESTEEIRFDHLVIQLPEGAIALDDANAAVKSGERVQVVGTSGTGNTLLFRVLAGMWPAGSGTLVMPPREDVVFLPPRPYLPPGRLRDILAYPQASKRFDTAQMVTALERLGLSGLAKSLESERRWDRDLTLAEQHCLAAARLLLHRPKWVVLDEVLETLDETTRTRFLDIFKQELQETAMVSIDREPLGTGFFNRVYKLARVSEEVASPAVKRSHQRRSKPRTLRGIVRS